LKPPSDGLGAGLNRFLRGPVPRIVGKTGHEPRHPRFHAPGIYGHKYSVSESWDHGGDWFFKKHSFGHQIFGH